MAKKPSAPQIVDLCAPFFLLGIQLAEGTSELPPFGELRQRVLALLDSVAEQARQRGFTPADIDDARYALAAYLDEIVQISAWPGKQQWSIRPLQMELFGEQMAGINFFTRLGQVRARSKAVAEVYYFCMTLGFHGRYRVDGNTAELAELVAALSKELVPKPKPTISVHVKQKAGREASAGGFPFLLVAGLTLVLAIVGAVALLLVLNSSSGDAAELLTKLGRG